jgi:acetamidase/formamidase
MTRALTVVAVLLISATAHAQATLDGVWVLSQDVYGNTLYQRLTLKIAGSAVTGTLGRMAITGTAQKGALHFVAGNDDLTNEFDGTLTGDRLSGTVVVTPKDDPKPERRTWSATRMPVRPAGPPRRHEFTPTMFQRQFSATIPPVLRIWPGDTVHTTTVDAAGMDEHGVSRVLGGNPQTGPFFVETAMPGDMLVVHLTRLRLNRDFAISDDGLVARATDSGLAVKLKDQFNMVRWHLDRDHGVATPEKPTAHLAKFIVPLRPMLGCIAVAPGFAAAPPGSGDSGRWGGNMDFNEVVEGATVMLPVGQPGALLYVGDGHAAQGDGELNGNALETSMDVEFTVDVVPQKAMSGPRVESATHIMTVGLAGSVDDSLRSATASLAQWLEQDYALTPSEIAMVLGTSVEYAIGEVADRNAGVVAKLRKDRLVFK